MSKYVDPRKLPHATNEKLLDRIISDKSLIPLLNGKKWVKLISLLVDNITEIKECRVKLLWEAESQVRYLRIDEFTSYNFNYYATAMEALITGTPRGWYAYREIEWLDFPRVVLVEERWRPAVTVAQNLELIQDLLQQTGQFHTALNEHNLRLYAYLQPAQPAL